MLGFAALSANLRRVDYAYAVVLMLAGCASPYPQIQPEMKTGPDESAALDFLIEKVCVMAGGAVLAVDPYDCPATDHLRPLQVGEALPYHKQDQPDPDRPERAQRHDSYPVRDRQERLIVVNPFDPQPFGVFMPARDGYDIFVARNGWASVSETRDVAGFATTFFGEPCRPDTGWVFFDLSSLHEGHLLAGNAQMPIAVNYWEHNGQSWPGRCPRSYSRDSLTSWEWMTDFDFGGINGARSKRLDAIRSVHGYRDDLLFRNRGHLEVFYFTRLYGITRWETWVPDEQFGGDQDGGLAARAARAARSCSGSSHWHYQDQDFTRTACRDWSNVTPQDSVEVPPAWPVPEMNLVENYHFGAGLAGWNFGGNGTPGPLLHWALKNSDTARDTRFVQREGKGPGYLSVGCGGPCSSGQSLYQDIPITPQMSSGQYTIAMTVRTEHGPGVIRMRLEQLDAQGKVLAATSAEDSIHPRNEFFDAAASIPESSRFVSHTIKLAVDAAAKSLRLSITPLSADAYDLSDVWLMKSSY